MADVPCRGYAGSVPVYCAHDRIVPIGDVMPNPKNPNQHPENQIEMLAKIITTQGWRAPVTVSTLSGLVVRGHGRLMAAKFAELDFVPVDFQNYESSDAELADLLADNKIAELAEIDNKLLAEVFENIDPDAIDIDLTGYSEDEYNSIISALTEEAQERELKDVDAEVTPPKVAVTKLGDIWRIGRHRLMCGSSTDEVNVATLMDGAEARVLFTSPPYSDMREYNGGKDLSVDNIASFIGKYRPYTDYQCVNLGIQRKEHEIVQYWDNYIAVARDSGYKLMAWNVWDKTTCGSIGNQSAFFPIRHEWIFVFGTEFYEINLTWDKAEESIKQGREERRVRQADGSLKASSKGDMSNPKKQMESVLQLYPEHGEIINEHPATFPVRLPCEYIMAMTDEGDNVIEPFGGSGSTLIACEQLGRNCFIMELDPIFCDVIVKRYMQVTGKRDVELIRNNEKFHVEQLGL